MGRLVDASSIKRAMQWYNRFIARCVSDIDDNTAAVTVEAPLEVTEAASEAPAPETAGKRRRERHSQAPLDFSEGEFMRGGLRMKSEETEISRLDAAREVDREGVRQRMANNRARQRLRPAAER